VHLVILAYFVTSVVDCVEALISHAMSIFSLGAALAPNPPPHPALAGGPHKQASTLHWDTLDLCQTIVTVWLVTWYTNMRIWQCVEWS